MAGDLPACTGWLEGLIFAQKWHDIYQLELDKWSPCYLK
jgi:hypothetical protein